MAKDFNSETINEIIDILLSERFLCERARKASKTGIISSIPASVIGVMLACNYRNAEASIIDTILGFTIVSCISAGIFSAAYMDNQFANEKINYLNSEIDKYKEKLKLVKDNNSKCIDIKETNNVLARIELIDTISKKKRLYRKYLKNGVLKQFITNQYLFNNSEDIPELELNEELGLVQDFLSGKYKTKKKVRFF